MQPEDLLVAAEGPLCRVDEGSVPVEQDRVRARPDHAAEPACATRHPRLADRWAALLAGLPRRVGVIATRPSTVLVLPTSEFTAIAAAKDPIKMAKAMKLAVESGRLSYQAGRMPRKMYADPSSPLAGLI